MEIQKYKARIKGTNIEVIGCIIEIRKDTGLGTYTNETDYLIAVTERTMQGGRYGTFKVDKESIQAIPLNHPSKQPNTATNSCFGRISEGAFRNLKSLDDLITKMNNTGDPDDFKLRLKHFKEFLKKELPEFSEKEILKYDRHLQKLRKIYDWKGAENFLIAIEYDARENY